MSRDKNINAGEKASKKDASTLDERINSKLMQSVRVKNMTPIVCVLKTGKGKENEIFFGSYQTKTILVKNILEVANSTKLFLGDDGKGTDAILFIDDEDIRMYLGFDEIDETGEVIEQKVWDEGAIQELLEEKNDKKFKQELEGFKGNIGKTKLLTDMVVKLNYNNAQRVKYIEKYLDIEISFDNEENNKDKSRK